MFRLTVLMVGALMGLLVAIEAANFAIYNISLKALPQLSAHLGTLELRIWTAIAIGSIAWIAAVKLTAMSLAEFRARRRQ